MCHYDALKIPFYCSRLQKSLIGISAEKLLRHDHPERHRRNEDERFNSKRAEICQSGPGTKSTQPPAHPKDRRADNEPPVNRFRIRRRQFRLHALAGGHLPQRQRPETIGRNCPRHNESQRRIPFSKYIQKPNDARGIGHSGDGESRPKKAARDQNSGQFRRAHRLTRLKMKTVIIATPTKIIVAAIESFAPVATPQTP